MALFKVTSLLENAGVGFTVQKNRFTLGPGESDLVVDKNQQIRILEDKGAVSVDQLEATLTGIEFPQYVTLNSGHVGTKKILLEKAVAESPTYVKLFFNDGTPQKYGEAFIVNSTNELTWDGLSLDGVDEEGIPRMAVGDRLLIMYPTIEVQP